MMQTLTVIINMFVLDGHLVLITLAYKVDNSKTLIWFISIFNLTLTNASP